MHILYYGAAGVLKDSVEFASRVAHAAQAPRIYWYSFQPYASVQQ